MPEHAQCFILFGNIIETRVFIGTFVTRNVFELPQWFLQIYFRVNFFTDRVDLD